MGLIDCLLLINQSLWHCLQHDTVVNNPLKVEMLRAAAARGIASVSIAGASSGFQPNQGKIQNFKQSLFLINVAYKS